jgi:hypothetical protein
MDTGNLDTLSKNTLFDTNGGSSVNININAMPVGSAKESK